MEDQRAVRSYECAICYMNGPEERYWEKSFTYAWTQVFQGLHGIFRGLFDSMDSIAGKFSRGGK